MCPVASLCKYSSSVIEKKIHRKKPIFVLLGSRHSNPSHLGESAWKTSISPSNIRGRENDAGRKEKKNQTCAICEIWIINEL